MDVEDRVASASRAFGALCRPVFHDSGLSLRTKRMVYRTAVLGVFLYGTKTWASKRGTIQKVETFNNRCLRRIMNISRALQRVGHISSVQVRKSFGLREALEDVLTVRRLRWLGHVTRMEDDRTPKQLCLDGYPSADQHMESS